VSKYKPQSIDVVPPSGIVPVVGTFDCKRWTLVATQYGSVHMEPSSGLFGKINAVFNFYMEWVGVSPYFTYGGHLFRFRYTGYDAKTKKYLPGGKNIFEMCTDGMSVQKNPPGHSPPYTAFPKTGGSGGSLTVHLGTGAIMKDRAFDLNLLQCVPCTSSNGGIAATHETAMQALREENCIAGLGVLPPPAKAPAPIHVNPGLVGGLVSHVTPVTSAPMPYPPIAPPVSPPFFPPAGYTGPGPIPSTPAPIQPAPVPSAPVAAPAASSIPAPVMFAGALLAIGVVGGFILVFTEAGS
jgi:hypothetical protein